MISVCCCFTALLWLGQTEVSAEKPPEDSAAVSRLIRELDHSDYAIRTRATQDLANRGAEVIEPLAAAIQDGSLEQRIRAVEIVSRIYSRGDVASFYAAEQILDRVSREGSGSLMTSARSALETNYLVRQRLAIAEFEKMGGRVLMVQPLALADAEEPEGNDQPMTDDDELVVGVMIDRTWTGGDDGLKHVRRLSKLLYLYRDKKAPLSPDALEDLQTDMPRLAQQVRGPAYLGIKPSDLRQLNGVPGCGIGEVTAGSAAAKAGILPQDLVTQFDQQPVRDFNSLIELIADKLPGEKVPITVLRDGEKIELEAELTAWPKMNFPP